MIDESIIKQLKLLKNNIESNMSKIVENALQLYFKHEKESLENKVVL